MRVRHSTLVERAVRASRDKSNGCLPRTRDRVTRPATSEQVHRPERRSCYRSPDERPLTARQRQVLEFIDAEVRAAGLPAERPGDRRGRRPVVDAPRCTRTSPRSRTRATSAATPPSPGRIEVALEPTPAPPSSAGRCATSRSSATSPPAPACSRPRTSRRRCPLPEDFTGDGDALHAAGPRRLDDRRRHLRRRLRRRAPAARRPTTATSSSPASPAKRRRSRRSCASATRSCCGRRTPTMDDMVFDPADVTIYGKVVTLLRRL